MNMNKLIAVVAICVATASSSSRAAEPDYFVPWVWFNGSQYIDTGITAKSGTKAEMWFTMDGGTCMLAAQGTQGALVFAQNWSNYIGGQAPGGTKNGNYFSKSYPVYEGDELFLHVTSELDSNGGLTMQINGESSKEVGTATTGASYNADRTLYLFAMNKNGSPDYYACGKCYGLKIWQTNGVDGAYTLVRHMKPCIKDGVAGMYDSVEDEILYPNSGALSCPYGYPDAFVQYIEADGNQGLDLGVIARAGTKTELRVNQVGNVMMGASSGVGTFNPLQVVSGGFIGCQYNGGSGKSGVKPGTGFHHVLSEIAADGKMSFSVDGKAATVEDKAPIDTGLNFNLFTMNYMGTNNWQYSGSGKCYGLKIWQTNDVDGAYSLVRDMKPCVKDGIVGLYDEVSHCLFTNVVRKAESSAWLSAPTGTPDSVVKYVGSTGAQVVDVGVIARAGTKTELCFTHTAGSVLLGASSTSSNSGFVTFAQTWGEHIGGQAGGTGKAYQTTDSYRMKQGKFFSAVSTLGTDGKLKMAVNDGEEVELSAAAGPSFDTGRSIYLFGANMNGITNHLSTANCYSLKIWQTNGVDGTYTLARDMKPCVKGNVAGLYDAVSDSIFYPLYGTLYAGPEVVNRRGLMIVVK